MPSDLATYTASLAASMKTRDWFVTTPVAIVVKNGIVISAKQSDATKLQTRLGGSFKDKAMIASERLSRTMIALGIVCASLTLIVY
jgi:hypothetical protein